MKDWKVGTKNSKLDWKLYDTVYVPVCTMAHWTFTKISINRDKKVIGCVHYNSIPGSTNTTHFQSNINKYCTEAFNDFEIVWKYSRVSHLFNNCILHH